MITVRFLAFPEYHKYLEFMKSQDKETRRMYFGVTMANECLDSLYENILDHKTYHRFIVAEDETFNVVGVLHLAEMDQRAIEIGIAVDRAYRSKGVGSQMMDLAIPWCRNRSHNEVYMHCLAYNEPVMKLVKKYKLKISTTYGDADAKVVLPPASPSTIVEEAFIIQQQGVRRWASNLAGWYKMFQTH